MFQLLTVLEYFNRSGIVHRDLHPDNIQLVIDENENEKRTVKISDFSYARLIMPNEFVDKNELFGKLQYASPEMCSRIDYGKETDMWSLGVIFYEMLMKKCPFESYNKASTMQKILHSNLNFNFKSTQYERHYTLQA